MGQIWMFTGMGNENTNSLKIQTFLNEKQIIFLLNHWKGFITHKIILINAYYL